ncbi:NAD(P)H-hydrate dehydratase [Paracoccus sp. R86501]|uniref:NAD(P)H-hydrate dehydratase n=1 Tax=Paracoccus sp. R86501 TaxID=3101711 RepID=UPI00366B5D6F
MLHGTEILTSAQMRATEAAAIASGTVTDARLMERAGRTVADQIRLRWPEPGRATVLCGPGNNGGDGYVIAHHLHRAGWQVSVSGMRGKAAGAAGDAAERWLQSGPIRPLQTVTTLPDQGVIVDAIFGTGLTRAPVGDLARILRLLSKVDLRDRIVAVDCPSGLCLDTGTFLGDGAQAGLTVAFDSPKPGHLIADGPTACGKLVVADIGLKDWRQGDPAGVRTTAPLDATTGRWLAKLHGKGHKFAHGSALVIAGGPGSGGAARLSARAALRTGAGLVTICPTLYAMPEHAGPPDALMRRPVDGSADLERLLQDDRIGGVCLGPGCGVSRAQSLLKPLLASGRPAMLDADAITALAQDSAPALHAHCVLTPHMGEFARIQPDLADSLSGKDGQPAISKLDAARQAAQRMNAVIVLKGPDTVIAAPTGAVRVHSAYDIPWLATAGAGDVLSGIITGLLARGLPAFEAACMGVTLHASAARRFGPGLIADDLPDQLPGVIRDLID